MWEWAKQLPPFVREKGWRAKAYSKGNDLQATYYHCSLFDIPSTFWLEMTEKNIEAEADGQKDLAARMDACGLTRAEGDREDGREILEGEEEEEEGGEGGIEGGGKKLYCRKCRCALPVEDRVSHYQSAWHVCNLRRSIAKK